MNRRVSSGIGLVEVLFVVLVMGLLAAAMIPRWVYSSEAKTGECQANVTILNAELDIYSDKHGGRLPATVDGFARSVEADKDRFPNGLPKCPYGRPYEYDSASGRVVAHTH